MSRPVVCAACGAEAPKAAAWYTIHLSARNPELLATASLAEIQYLGEKSACSRECLIQLVREWAGMWQSRKKEPCAAGK